MLTQRNSGENGIPVYDQRTRLTFILLRGVGLTPLRPPLPPPPPLTSASSLPIRLNAAMRTNPGHAEPVPRRIGGTARAILKTREFTSRTRGPDLFGAGWTSCVLLDHDSISRVISTIGRLDVPPRRISSRARCIVSRERERKSALRIKKSFDCKRNAITLHVNVTCGIASSRAIGCIRQDKRTG